MPLSAQNAEQRAELVAQGQLEYLANCEKLDQDRSDIGDLQKIEDFFANNRVKVVKYNHAHQGGGATQTCYDAFMQLSPDRERLVFSKKIFRKRYQVLTKMDDEFINNMNDTKKRMGKVDGEDQTRGSKVRGLIGLNTQDSDEDEIFNHELEEGLGLGKLCRAHRVIHQGGVQCPEELEA
jgi:hypothetical protein